MSSSAHVPKAVLYYNPSSVWASVVLLGLKEKGYGSDELDFRTVDLRNGENFSPAYIRINPNGTVPTLVVPLENTFAVDIPNKYCAVTDTKSILEILDKSRSASSRTHTTSLAPAPALAPATISLSEVSTSIINLLHSVPVNFLSVAALTPEGLVARATSRPGEHVKLRQAALERYMEQEFQGASEQVKELWETRYKENGSIMRVYSAAGLPVSDLNAQQKQEREEFFKSSVQTWTGIKDILTRLENEMVGPYTLGDQLSLADIHLGAWFTRLLFVSGAESPSSLPTTPKAGHPLQSMYSGFKILEVTLREFTRDDTFTLGPKLCVFFELFKDRESWKDVYKDGLH